MKPIIVIAAAIVAAWLAIQVIEGWSFRWQCEARQGYYLEQNGLQGCYPTR